MTTTVRAAVLQQAPGGLAVRELELDERLEADEVRVRVAACGLCHSDLHFLEGSLPTTLPTVPGHEIAGVVTDVGSGVADLAVGDSVVACLSIFCGRCEQCRIGQSWLCPYGAGLGQPADRPRPRWTLDGAPVGQLASLGGLAEQTIVHRNALARIPETMPLDNAGLLGCAVITGFGAATRGARVEVGSTVAVIGCGGVGLNVVQGAVAAGARRIVAIDLNEESLAQARRFGATDSVRADQAEPVAAVRDLLGTVDHAFDVVGSSATSTQALRMLQRGRTAWLVGVPALGATLDLPGTEMLFQGKGVQGLLMGSNRFDLDIPELVELYFAGTLQLDELVSTRLPLTRVNDGFDRMREGGCTRIVVDTH